MASDLFSFSAPASAAPPGYPPGFMVLHGNRLEDLRDLLTQFLKSQPLGPLQSEVVLVQSNGMKHWLEMALADDAALGICAATRMELPSSYLWQTYRQVLGADAVPHHMPFDKASLLWRLMRLLPAVAQTNPVYAPLRRYLQAPDVAAGDAPVDKAQPAGRRLYQLAQQIADVLDGYQSYRADWLSDWAQGRDVLRSHLGKAEPMDATHSWQAQLWRDIRADIAADLRDASRAAVHARFCHQLESLAKQFERTGARPPGLPERVVVFGISSLPMQTVEALALLGKMSQVLMLVQNPCQYYWGDIVDGHDLLRQSLRRRHQAKPAPMEAQATPATHPLLASWGKQGRDYLHLLDDYDRVKDYQARLTRVDAFVDPALLQAEQKNPDQLAQVQSAILHLNPLPEQPLPLLDGDDSITLVSAHSAQREVEVLHDRLLAWFESDPSLQARDVMVMVPDMETFAPHIHAVFGRFAKGQPRHVPYSVADATERQSPLVQALEQILSLPGSRISLLDWLGLFEVAAVRSRFALKPADMDQLKDWLATAGVRWGLDARHRKAWGVAELPGHGDQNTWAFGLRRLLLGYAVGQGDAWGATLPQPALGSLDAPLIGSLLAWVEAVSQTLRELSIEQTPEQWVTTLTRVADRFFKPSDEADERQLQRMLDPLEDWQKACTDAQLDTPLPLEVVRDHWLSQISEAGLHQRFFGGGVQFGTLMPMRSIPFRVICLLGMNDGDYPRQTAARDFDLMTQSWRAGDRSRREDDRYLFLEAMLSARDRLYISWQGHKATDNTVQPPSVLVAQLQDYLNSGWTPKREAQVQPLQPYSEAYYLEGSAFQTFDADWARVHSAPANHPEAEVTAKPAPAKPSPEPPTSLTLEDLRMLMRAPVEVYFRSHLQVRFVNPEEEQQELEPFGLNSLERYQISQAVLRAKDPHTALAQLRWSGQLPLAAFADKELGSLNRDLDEILAKQESWRAKYPHDSSPVPVHLALDGTELTGTLNGFWAEQPPPGEEDINRVAYDRAPALLQIGQRFGAVLVGSKDRYVARGHIVGTLWVNHLAACASGLQVQTVMLGLDGQVMFKAMPAQAALAELQNLISIYQQAWLQPLPVACKTAWEFLQASLKAKAKALPPDATEAPDSPDLEAESDSPNAAHSSAKTVFEGGFKLTGEWQTSPYLQRAFSSYADIASGLPHWAHALYGPMANACAVTKFGAAKVTEASEDAP